MNTKNRKELERLLSLSSQQLKAILIKEIDEDRILEIEKSVRKKYSPRAFKRYFTKALFLELTRQANQYIDELSDEAKEKICQIYCKRKYSVDVADIIIDALLESISDMTLPFSVFFLKIYLNRICRCNNTQIPHDQNRRRRFGKGNKRRR
jgi:hypothetical protein